MPRADSNPQPLGFELTALPLEPPEIATERCKIQKLWRNIIEIISLDRNLSWRTVVDFGVL